VSVSGDVAVVGASGTDDNGPNSGSAYVFIGLCDSDGDGVCDSDDVCPNSTLDTTLTIDDCETHVANESFDDGCTMADRIVECAGEAGNHGQFVSCVAHLTNDWRADGLISPTDRSRIQACAARSSTRKPLHDVSLLGKRPLPVGGER
jgi:hypothetical protein